MAGEKDNPDARLEAMLRRWGAATAAEQAEPPAMPKLAKPRRRRPVRRIRWVPISAAAALLLVAATAAVFLVGPFAGLKSGPGRVAREGAQSAPAAAPSGADTRPSADQRRIDDLLAALARAEGRLRQRDAELGRQKDRLGDLERALGVQEQQRRDLAGRAADLAAKLGAAEQKRAAAEAALAQAKEPSEARKELAAVKADLAAAEASLAAMRRELAGARQLAEDASAEAKEALGRLALLAARRGTELGDLQRAYLGALAPGQAGLRARQAAAGRAGIAERLTRAGRLVRTAEAARLTDQLEAIFLRLQLLDTAKDRSAAAFVSMVADARVVEGIDAVLAAAAEGPELRRLLLEARLILMELDHVG